MQIQYIDGRLWIQWSLTIGQPTTIWLNQQEQQYHDYHHNFDWTTTSKSISVTIISTIITIITTIIPIITSITTIITIITTIITITTIISTMTCLGRSRAAVPQCWVRFAATVEQRQLKNISQFYHIFVGVSFITFLSESVLFLSKSVFFTFSV